MEVFLVDTASGEECAVPVSESDTALHLKNAAHSSFQFPPDSEAGDLVLSAGPDDVVLQDDALLSGMPCVEAGCRIDVALGGSRFTDDLRKGASDLPDVPAWARSLRECVMAAVEYDGAALKDADECMRADREVVLLGTTSRFYVFSSPAFMHASPALKRDKDFVLQVVRRYGGALEYADPSLCADREVVLEAAREGSCGTLQYAAPTVASDREVVLESVSHYGFDLQHADVVLTRDREVVVVALTESGSAFRFVDEELRADPELLLLALRSCPTAMRHAGTISKSLMLQAVNINWECLTHSDYCNDRDVVMAAVAKHGDALAMASPELRKDPELMAAALRSRPKAKVSQASSGV